MRFFDLSCRLLADAFWTRVFEHAESGRRQIEATFFADLGGLDALRTQAQYNTGSISTSTQWALFALANYWRPETVAEVGTFIGKSAVAMAKGCDHAGVQAEIHTCDMSNRIELPKLTRSILLQYQGMSSMAMFGEMVADGYEGRVQMIHLDGRATKEDIPLMSKLLSPDGIVVLDDFEGVEKGVANVYNFRAAGAFSQHVLLYPPSPNLLERFGLKDFCSTGVLLPQSAIRVTAQ